MLLHLCRCLVFSCLHEILLSVQLLSQFIFPTTQGSVMPCFKQPMDTLFTYNSAEISTTHTQKQKKHIGQIQRLYQRSQLSGVRFLLFGGCLSHKTFKRGMSPNTKSDISFCQNAHNIFLPLIKKNQQLGHATIIHPPEFLWAMFSRRMKPTCCFFEGGHLLRHLLNVVFTVLLENSLPQKIKTVTHFKSSQKETNSKTLTPPLLFTKNSSCPSM